MSEEAPRYFRVGVFVLVGFALIVVFVIALGGQALFRETVLMVTYFDESVQGLEVGSPVKVRGVELGSVAEIGMVGAHYEFDSTVEELRYGRRVRVLMELTPRQGTTSGRALSQLEQMIEDGGCDCA